LIVTGDGGTVRDYLPGDIAVFLNPQGEKAIWRTENTIFLGNDQYFGPGLGIYSKEGIIKELNDKRVKDATTTASRSEDHVNLVLPSAWK
jgi:protein-glutamine gamma-glutamyltransferase